MDTEPVVMKKRKKKMETTVMSHIEEEEEEEVDDENEEEVDDEEYYYYSSSSSPQRKRERSSGSKLTPRKGSSNNKRRFSEEQVRSLERIFELETTKLEPRKKVEVAREVGLQPRQVAIWFQNKRARWKSKEMEKNYRSLKASFDCLKSRYESMKMEKEALLSQMQELRYMVEDNQQQGGGLHRIDRRFGEGEEEGKKVEKERIDHEGPARDYDYMAAAEDDHKGMIAGSCEYTRETLLEIEGCNNKINGEVNSEDQPQLLTNVSSSSSQHMEMMSCFVPPARWCSFDSGGGGCLYDMQTSSVNYCSPWWESLS